MRKTAPGIVAALAVAMAGSAAAWADNGTATHPTTEPPMITPPTTQPADEPTTPPTEEPTTRPTTRPTTQPVTTLPAFWAETAAQAEAEAKTAREKAVEALRGLDKPKAFDLAEQAYRDAAFAQRQEHFEPATLQYRLAKAHFDTARLLAPAMTEVAAARAAWVRAIDAADAAVLTRYVGEEFAALKATIVQAVDLTTTEPAEASGLYRGAVDRLAVLVASALKRQFAEKVAAAVKTVENALTRGDWLAAGKALDALVELAPEDAQVPVLRRRLTDITPPKEIAVDLGDGVTIKMVLIRPGTFTMGSPPDEAGRDDDEGPTRTVTITRPFYLGAFEVTQSAYQKVMFDNPSISKGADRPVTNVQWRQAALFARRLTDDARKRGDLKTGEEYRLPTEAEWEYAARAGSTTAYCAGNSVADLRDYAVFGRAEHEGPERVGQKKPNAFGVYDLHGNVWEWCADWYAKEYPPGAATDPVGPGSGPYRVQRGGGWRDRPDQCRSAARKPGWPTSVYDDVGFRLLKTIPGPWD